MKHLHLQETWPESWKYSFHFDLQEVFGPISQRGYAYAYQNRRRFTLQLITQVVPRGARILDLAGGQGNFSLSLAELGYDVTWNDLRSDLAGYVQLKHERGRLSFAPGNAFEISFPAKFDAVLITEIIEHVAHPDEFLAKTASLVESGGYVIMTTPNGAYFRNTLPKFSECPDPSRYEEQQFKPDADGHIFLLHPQEVASLAQAAGLRLEEMALFTNPLTGGHLKTEILLSALPKRGVEAIEELTQRLSFPLKTRLMIQLAARFVKP